MKRAKIMLLTIAVFATVGTALAFKVAKKGNTTYCIEQTSTQPDHCLVEINNATMIPGTQVFYYTTKTAPCETLICNKTANRIAQ